jgi:hypothetical protein
MQPHLEPFFTFFGGRWRIAPLYPKPKHNIIVEPFAGSAGYSMRYPDRQVVLVERDPVIAATWRYLIEVSESEILALPEIRAGECVDDLQCCQEAKYLIGWWCGRGRAQPGKSLGGWGRDPQYANRFWGDVVKDRIARQVQYIKHWTVIEDSYENIPTFEATWFVDPPYLKTGHAYRCNGVNYLSLVDWIVQLTGQVIVCEGKEADWLPFEPFVRVLGNNGYSSEERVFIFSA